jgi:hypothetical protein
MIITITTAPNPPHTHTTPPPPPHTHTPHTHTPHTEDLRAFDGRAARSLAVTGEKLRDRTGAALHTLAAAAAEVAQVGWGVWVVVCGRCGCVGV